MLGLLMLKGIYIKKRDQGEFLCAKIQKIIIVIKNVIWSEKTLMHKAVRPSNYFFQFFHIQSGRADKDRSNLCPNFDRNTPY